MVLFELDGVLGLVDLLLQLGVDEEGLVAQDVQEFVHFEVFAEGIQSRLLGDLEHVLLELLVKQRYLENVEAGLLLLHRANIAKEGDHQFADVSGVLHHHRLEATDLADWSWLLQLGGSSFESLLDRSSDDLLHWHSLLLDDYFFVNWLDETLLFEQDWACFSVEDDAPVVRRDSLLHEGYNSL